MNALINEEMKEDGVKLSTVYDKGELMNMSMKLCIFACV